MHVLFLAPDTHVYNHHFLRGLRAVGATVSAIGPLPRERLSAAVNDLLDDYEPCAQFLDAGPLQAAAERLARRLPFDRVETIDEPLVEPAAVLRERFQLPGLSVAIARLCRDKAAMKELLRGHGIACAQSTGASSAAEVRAFAERCGYPLVVKPIAGFGALQTFRIDDAARLDQLLQRQPVDASHRVAVEEFIEGHEGFFDTITDQHGVRHDFAAHYYPGCLEAAQDRRIAPQIAVTNRSDGDGYRELRAMGRQVIDALGIRNCGTHMEWFFGPKGLKFSEIGARPAGEKIWDMYRFANDFDVFREWALAVLGLPAEATPSRRLAAGSVQIRPDRDGTVVEHRGLHEAWQRCRAWIYEHETPAPGSPTKPLDKGWLCNVWFRLRHEDYDQLRELMTFLGRTVSTIAR